MQLQVTIQEGHVLVANGDTAVTVELAERKRRAWMLPGPVRTSKDCV